MISLLLSSMLGFTCVGSQGCEFQLTLTVNVVPTLMVEYSIEEWGGGARAIKVKATRTGDPNVLAIEQAAYAAFSYLPETDLTVIVPWDAPIYEEHKPWVLVEPYIPGLKPMAVMAMRDRTCRNRGCK